MTKAMRERVISVSFSMGLLFVGAVFSHFFWQKQNGSMELKDKIKSLEERKMDKSTFTDWRDEHVRLQIESENRIIDAIKEQGTSTDRQIKNLIESRK